MPNFVGYVSTTITCQVWKAYYYDEPCEDIVEIECGGELLS